MLKVGDVIEFILPLYVMLPRKTKVDRKVYLNMNWYRRAQFHEIHAVEREFMPLQLPIYFKAKKIRVSYRVEKKHNRLYDTTNVTAVVDKLFLDWLVKGGYIEDDNCLIVEHGGATGHIGQSENRCIAWVEILELPEQENKQRELFS